MIFTKEPTWQKELIHKIAKELNLNVRVVREIAYYPLLFLKREISSETSERPIRIRQLGVWHVRSISGKITILREKGKLLMDNADLLWDKVKTNKGDDFESPKRFSSYVKYMIGKRNHRLIRIYCKILNELM